MTGYFDSHARYIMEKRTPEGVLDFSEPQLSSNYTRKRNQEGNTHGVLVCAIIGALCLMTLVYALVIVPGLEKRKEREWEEEKQRIDRDLGREQYNEARKMLKQ